ncbi:putative vitamin uptake transporter family protein [Candidatus Hepatincolaceae symbiont of Richtersius coronifer]
MKPVNISNRSPNINRNFGKNLGKNLDNRFVILISLFIATLTMSYFLSIKVIAIFGLHFSASLIPYALTFPIIHLISESFGRPNSKKVFKVGFYITLFIIIFFMIISFLPNSSSPYNFNLGMGVLSAGMLWENQWAISVSLILIYLVSHGFNLWIYHFLKEKTKGRSLWLRNIVATISSQLLATLISITILYFLSSTPGLVKAVLLSQIIIKLILVLIDTPFVYLGALILRKNRFYSFDTNKKREFKHATQYTRNDEKTAGDPKKYSSFTRRDQKHPRY